MSVFGLTIVFVAGTFCLYGLIAWLSRAKSAEDFYVAGSEISPVTNALATAADWMSVAGMLSIPGLIAFLGYDASVYLIGPIGGFALLGILIAPYLRKFGKFTIPDFVGDRYYSNKPRNLAILIALSISLTYLAGQMRGVGVVFSHFLEIDVNQGVLIGALVVMIYAVWGGMKGITYTQVAQFCVLAFAFLTPIIYMSFLLTGKGFIYTSYASTLPDGTNFLTALDELNQQFGFKEFTAPGRPIIDTFCICATLMFGTASMPHILIRFFTVPKIADARKSVAFTGLFLTLIFIATPPLAAFSRTYFLKNINNQRYDELPPWFKKWENTELIEFNDLNGDGIVQYTGTPENELTIDFDITFLAVPEIANLPAWMIALVAAGAIAAALSTAAGLLLVTSTAISHDLIKKQINPQLSNQGELRVARICIFFAVLISIYFGINPPGFIIETVALAFSMAAAGFFPALLLGIFYPKLSRPAALWGMTSGFVFVVGYIIYFQFMGGKTHGYWLDISAQGIGLVGMLINLMICLVAQYFCKPAPQSIQQMVDDLHQPD